MNEIVMPKLSDTMTEGRVVSWKKRVGEPVRRGEVLAEVETDKANMELEAFAAGVLLEIKVQEGELAPVGTVIALIGQPEEKGAQGAQPAGTVEPPAHPAGEGGEPAAEKPPEEAAPPKPQPEAGAVPPGAAPTGEESTGPVEPWEMPQPPEEQQPSAASAITPEGKQPPSAAQPAPPAAAPQPEPQAAGQGTAQQPAGVPLDQGSAEVRERAAPVVRRRARELGIELSQVKGSGPDGRILLQDLERHKGAPAAAEKPAGQKPAAAEEKRPPSGQARPLPRLRAAIAKTVSESWKTIPHFTVTMDILMDEAESIRHQLKQAGKPVTVNDMVVKAVALALQKFPQQHASFTAEGMELHDDINIGVAVGVPDGVVIPVITGCQKLSLAEISQAGRKLVEKARIGALTEQEMSGGNFAVSNLGMYGVTQFSAVIYPSHAGVLAVGAVIDTAVIRCGLPASAKIMKVTLSADHRLVDGAYAAQFLAEFKQLLENPVRLLI